jgi:septum formation protein
MTQRIKSMLHKILNTHQLILASRSPRRREIFDMLSLDYEIKISDVAEPISNEDPILQAMRHAQNKAKAVFDPDRHKELIVAADTMVLLDNKILGKPDTLKDAAIYLHKLSGNSHTVITGLCIGNRSGFRTGYEQSKVWFARLSKSEIRDYVATGEPMDKAGAYGIQGYGSQFVTRIEGCFFNVMGFPIRRFYEMTLAMEASAEL